MRLSNMNKDTLVAPKGKYAQLTLAFPFKKAFASEECEDLLIALLNAFLEKKLANPITEVFIPNPYIQGQTKVSPDALLDIECWDSTGNCFIMGTQIGSREYFIKRVICHTNMAVAYGGRRKVHSLNFLNCDFNFGINNEDVVENLSFRNEKHPEEKFDYISLVCVQLTKFNKSIDECESFRDKLLFCLCNAHKLDEKPKQLEGKLFDKLFEVARISNFSADELAEYEANRMNM